MVIIIIIMLPIKGAHGLQVATVQWERAGRAAQAAAGVLSVNFWDCEGHTSSGVVVLCLWACSGAILAALQILEIDIALWLSVCTWLCRGHFMQQIQPLVAVFVHYLIERILDCFLVRDNPVNSIIIIIMLPINSIYDGLNFAQYCICY
jgi:hypothetical protein